MHPTSISNPADPAPASPAVVGAIPARYDSTRLPGKALRPIAGVPMIERVYRQAEQAEGLTRIVVLTDDERIAEAVAAFGGSVELTPTACASGTDRVAWALGTWEKGRRAAAVVNIQGDEPLIDPREISRVARHLAEHPGDPVVTLAAPGTEADAANPEVVKVVLDRRGYALYFSRAPIPFARRADAGASTLCHLGIYGYQREALLKIAAAEPTPLERSESLEQLRMLEHGIPIRVLESARGWWGVDTIEDLERVEEILRRETVGEPAAARSNQGDKTTSGDS